MSIHQAARAGLLFSRSLLSKTNCISTSFVKLLFNGGRLIEQRNLSLSQHGIESCWTAVPALENHMEECITGLVWILPQIWNNQAAIQQCDGHAQMPKHSWGGAQRCHGARKPGPHEKCECCRCALFPRGVLITHNSRGHVLSALLSHFFFFSSPNTPTPPAPPPVSLRALFKVILALHMAD